MKKVSKTAAVKKYQLPIEISQNGNYFVANCPGWADCYAQGGTIDEATAEIIGVAGSLIELYEEEELKVPLLEVKNSLLQTPSKISFTVPVFSTV